MAWCSTDQVWQQQVNVVTVPWGIPWRSRAAWCCIRQWWPCHSGRWWTWEPQWSRAPCNQEACIQYLHNGRELTTQLLLHSLTLLIDLLYMGGDKMHWRRQQSSKVRLKAFRDFNHISWSSDRFYFILFSNALKAQDSHALISICGFEEKGSGSRRRSNRPMMGLSWMRYLSSGSWPPPW